MQKLAKIEKHLEEKTIKKNSTQANFSRGSP
jgi:hypothetical protein